MKDLKAVLLHREHRDPDKYCGHISDAECLTRWEEFYRVDNDGSIYRIRNHWRGVEVIPTKSRRVLDRRLNICKASLS